MSRVLLEAVSADGSRSRQIRLETHSSVASRVLDTTAPVGQANGVNIVALSSERYMSVTGPSTSTALLRLSDSTVSLGLSLDISGTQVIPVSTVTTGYTLYTTSVATPVRVVMF